MKSIASLVKRFRESLQTIPDDVRRRVNRPGGLDEEKLLDLIVNPQDYGVMMPELPSESDVSTTYNRYESEKAGEDAITSGQVAYCILAGGAGTRIGEPKALLKMPDSGISLLSLKLLQARGAERVWIIVSPGLKDKISEHLSLQSGFDSSKVKLIEQYESYRITPDNQILVENGKPDLYPCGHGDVFSALLSSGELDEFSSMGGKYVSIVNVDNVAASLDPVVIGRHILSGKNVTCEVVKKLEKDSGGFLCNVNGSIQIVESFRIQGIDIKKLEWLNTNSFVFSVGIDLKPLGNRWNRVQKTVNNRIVIQHERLLQEITSAYDTSYIEVKREDRFMPIKSQEDLSIASEKLNANRKFL